MCSLRNGMLVSAASLMLLGAMTVAQTNAPANTNSNAASSKTNASSSVSASDRHFIDKAAAGGMAEVELGQLAEQNGGSQQVRDFGKRMVDDHSKANDELKQIAAQKDVELPAGLGAQDQATKDKLSKLHGDAFDKAYMRDMVRDHKKDIAECKHESNSAKDPELKNWAGKTLPTLQSHLQLAEQIAPQTKSGAMSKNSSSMNNGTTASEQH